MSDSVGRPHSLLRASPHGQEGYRSWRTAFCAHERLWLLPTGAQVNTLALVLCIGICLLLVLYCAFCTVAAMEMLRPPPLWEGYPSLHTCGRLEVLGTHHTALDFCKFRAPTPSRIISRRNECTTSVPRSHIQISMVWYSPMIRRYLSTTCAPKNCTESTFPGVLSPLLCLGAHVCGQISSCHGRVTNP